MKPASILLLVTALATIGCEGPPKREGDTLANVRPLTAGFASASEGRVSRDGRWAIFRAVPPGERVAQMYVAPVRQKGDGIAAFGPPARITPDGTANTGGTFSPDAASIVFSSTARGERANESPATAPTRSSFQIFRADGWQAAMAVVERDVGFDFAKHPITRDADARNVDATFTPDGRWILFSSDRDGSGNVDLWAMRADGSKPQRLTTAPGADASPAISPDGKRVCFRADRAGDGRTQLWLADLVFTDDRVALEKERQLTNNPLVNYAATWHPSGKYLLFTASQLGQVGAADDLWLIRDDGYRRCRLTFAPGFDGLPMFASDGNQLLWTSTRTPDGTAQLYLATFKLPTWVKTANLLKERG